jgi:hypothetical protein
MTSAPPTPASLRHVLLALSASVALSACGGGDDESADAGAEALDSRVAPAAVVTTNGGPAAGYFGSSCSIPSAAWSADTSKPTRVVGTGTPASCTSDAVVAAVAQGGVVKFNCGPDPVVITMTKTAKIFNNKPNLVLDGGNKVTLSGGGKLRVLYQNTCDPNQVYTSSRCDIQDTPRTTVQNLTFVDGNSAGQSYGRGDVYGGGAIFVRGGSLKVVNSRFFRNQCESTGPDLGGAAIRLMGTSPTTPNYIVKSTFGGASGYGNSCSNGGAISGLHASVVTYNAHITHNRAIGYGANPARSGTPGGGSGGGIYTDGNTFKVDLNCTRMANNSANEGGGGVFYVSNNRTGTMRIANSLLETNTSGRFETTGYPGVFVLAAPGNPVVTNSTLRR